METILKAADPVIFSSVAALLVIVALTSWLRRAFQLNSVEPNGDAQG